MKVLIAPDNFGGTLSAPDAATAIAAGWCRRRPQDELTLVPLSDGGEGLLDVLVGMGGTIQTREVAGPQGHPLLARMLLQPDGTAVIESATACGLHLLPLGRRTPSRATTYGVGQLLEAARESGARRILVGLGGSATVDGGAGALIALGYHVQVGDGSGLKIGAEDLHRVTRIDPRWSADWSDVEVELLADVTTPVAQAAERFGAQKGATPAEIRELTAALAAWAHVVTRDLHAVPGLATAPGSGAAGGLGFGLAAALGAWFVPGCGRVAELVGFGARLERTELVITGEGRLDQTSAFGKVVGHVVQAARERGVRTLAVVGQDAGGDLELDDVEASAPDGVVEDADAQVTAAAERAATRFSARDAAR